MKSSNHSKVGNSWARNPVYGERDIRQEYDEAANEYDEASENWDYRGAKDSAAFLGRLLSKSAKIMDAGCGTGLVGKELFDLGFRDLYGTDLSGGMLEIATNRNVYSGGVYQANISKMPFQDEYFDCLISIAVLTHVPTVEPVFEEFERVVKIGGLISFSHRIDLEEKCDFSEALSERLAMRKWKAVNISEPMLYYPKKLEYGDKIRVRYHAYYKN